jgi:uncharacterized membrane protein YgaE (UPF0421/DUF939 family)
MLVRNPWLRLRLRAWPILQTAVAAVVSWYLAKLLLPENQPLFASVAAVIAVGATYGQRSERAVELIGGVVIGIGVADLLVRVIGSGPAQIGVMVLLAMSAAVLVGGGPLLVTEAAVSAILLVVLEPTTAGLAPSRVIEAVIGGAVALGVSALAFPPDPRLAVGRCAQGIFGALGHSLENLSAALADRDAARAGAALDEAREIDGAVRELDEALAIGHETARFSLWRGSSLGELERYNSSARHIDFAVRNTRVLARHVLRYIRAGGATSDELTDALRELSLAVWALAAELDDPARARDEVRTHATRAAGQAVRTFESQRDLGVAEIVAQVRSVAIDLMRAAEAGTAPAGSHVETPTEELLIELPAAA